MTEPTSVHSPGPHGGFALSIDAAVLDVGLAGIAIESESRLTPERKLVVRLGADDPVVLPGRVVWCFFHGTEPAASGEQRPVYRAGVEFADLLTPSAQRLVAFLEHQIQAGGEARLFGRFPVARSQPVHVETGGEFRLVAFEDDRVDLVVELAVEPLAGQLATVRPRSGGLTLRAPVVAAWRDDLPDAWLVSLDLRGTDPSARAALHGVAFD